MRIAVLNRQRAAFPGGDLHHIDCMSVALKPLGIRRVYAPEGWTLEWLSGFDLAHVYHVNFSWSRYNVERCWDIGTPYVLTCILYDSEKLGVDGRWMKDAVDNAHKVQVYSPTEERVLRQMTGTTREIEVFTPGVGPEYHYTATTGRKGVIAVTPRSGAKNTDTVAELCAKSRIPFQVVCGLSREELIAVYRKSRVVVSACLDSFGHTIAEGLAAGCKAVVGDRVWYWKDVVPGLESLADVYYGKVIWDYGINQRVRDRDWGVAARDTVEKLYRGIAVRGFSGGYYR